MDKRRIRHFADFSDEVAAETSLPHIDLDSNKRALVDGCRGIVEYNSDTVRIDCKKLVVKFSGCDLSIRALSVDRICVSGNIVAIEFCSL